MPHHVPDPLTALGSLWDATRDEIARENSDAVVDSLSDRLDAIEKQMIPLVALTSEGLSAQVRVLHALVPDDYAELVDNILAGVHLLLS